MNKLKMPGEWHNYIQNLFPCEWQEICSQDKSRRADVMNSDKKIVLEIQHSYCTKIEKKTTDWNKWGYNCVWIFDGRKAENTNCLDLFRCQRILQNTKDIPELIVYIYVDNEHVYPIQTSKFKKYTAKVQPITLQEFVANVKSGTICEVIPKIENTIVTIRQDPPGSGKTYSMTLGAINDKKYKTTIIVCQEHAPLHVISENIKNHTGWEEEIKNKSYIFNNNDRIIIIATMDSLMYNLSQGKSDDCTRGTFKGMAETVSKNGPQLTASGHTRFKGEFIRFCCQTKIIVDEATKTDSESYLVALDRIMQDTGADLHICGDSLQSTKNSENLMKKCKIYFQTRSDVKLISTEGNEIRRFGKAGTELLTKIIPYERLGIQKPIPHQDAPKDTDIFCHSMNTDVLLGNLEKDIVELNLEPKDVLIICIPTYEEIFEELQVKINNLWYNKGYVEGHFLSYLHTSEEGKPIDLSLSDNSTRMVSIHSSQGDGRNLVYVVGLCEKHIVKYVRDDNDPIKYWSFVNVCLSRMKRRMRIFVPEIDKLTIQFDYLIADNNEKKELTSELELNSPIINSSEIFEYADLINIKQVKEKHKESEVNKQKQQQTEWSDNVFARMVFYFQVFNELIKNERFEKIMVKKVECPVSNTYKEDTIYLPEFKNKTNTYNKIRKCIDKIKTKNITSSSVEEISCTTYMVMKQEACKAFKLYEIFESDRPELKEVIKSIISRVRSNFRSFYDSINENETVKFANVAHPFSIDSTDLTIQTIIPIFFVTDAYIYCIYPVNKLTSMEIYPRIVQSYVDKIIFENCDRNGTTVPSEFMMETKSVKSFLFSISTGHFEEIQNFDRQLGIDLITSGAKEKYNKFLHTIYLMYDSNCNNLSEAKENINEIWIRDIIASAVDSQEEGETWSKDRFMKKCNLKLEKCFQQLRLK